MRTNPTQLPTYKELQQILSSEAKREIPKEKIDKHYGDFTTIVNLLNVFNLPPGFFTEDLEFENLSDPVLFKEVVTVFNNLVKAVLNTRAETVKHKYFDDLYDYLAEEDNIIDADLIFVFGSKKTLRVEKAIDLYRKGYASKILISGGGPFYEENSVSEAEILGNFAMKEGVPRECIMLERESITVPDNVKRSLNFLERESIPHRSIILVNSPFSQRRGWAHFSKMSSVKTKLIRVNSDKVTGNFSKEGWYKDETGTKIVIKEFFGLRVSELINTS